jgi:hypothetical protein
MLVGGGDTILAYGLYGKENGWTLGKVKEGSEEVYELAKKWISDFGKKKVGYLPITINHLYHGDLKDRNYNDRYKNISVIKKYFSMIIPTMWRSDKISKMIPIYEECDYIKEIIIIDNDPDKKFLDLSKYKKIKYYTEGKNLFVNPSWNKGYSICQYELLLVNDDLIIEDISKILNIISNCDLDIIGVDINTFGNTTLEIINSEFPGNGYGSFMYIKKYRYIPEQLKIWYGDNIQYDNSDRKGIIRNANIKTDKSETINSNMSLFRNNIGQNDIIEYKSIYNRNDNDDYLNIIIRTSNRPLYFRTCVESIKKNVKKFKLHITIDSISDLDYVNDTLKDNNFSYYLINKQTIEDICLKIKIERQKFIYNYYFNVVFPFANRKFFYIIVCIAPRPSIFINYVHPF